MEIGELAGRRQRGERSKGEVNEVGREERRASLGSLDSVGVAKEGMTRNEVLRVGDEEESGEKGKGGILFPPMVRGALGGKGVPSGGRL